MKNIYTIYALIDPISNEIRYIGMTFNPKERFKRELFLAMNSGKTHRDYWIKKILDQGLKPIFKIIESGINGLYYNWQDRERFWISECRKSCRLTNLTDGGEGVLGWKPTDKTKKKMSIGHIGKKRSLETIEKIRIGNKGKKLSSLTKNKISKSRLGKKHTLESIQKMSNKKLGKIFSKTHRQNMSNSSAWKKQVICIETGQIFSSITKTANFLNVVRTSVQFAIRTKGKCKGSHYKFL